MVITLDPFSALQDHAHNSRSAEKHVTGVHRINALGRHARSEHNQETVKRGGREHPWASLRRKPR